MDTLLNIRFAVSLIYIASAASYIMLLRGTLKRPALPSQLLRAALALHVLEIVARGAEAGTAGGAPFVGTSGFVSTFALLLGGIYLVLEFRYKVHALGAFHIPVVCCLQIAGAVFKQPLTTISPIKTGTLVIFHVVPTAIAYAALTASFVAAVAYLLLDRQLRRKSVGVLMRGLPHLDLVEAVNIAGVRLGVPLLAVGILFGAAVGHHAFGRDYHWDLKNFVTLAILLLYSLQLLLRRYAGVTGRRSVLISCLGFASILAGITVINAFFSAMHGLA